MLIKLKAIVLRCRPALRWLMWSGIVLLLLLAILAGLTRALGSMAGRYQPQVTAMISQQIHLPVHVERLSVDWQGLNPELVLNRVVIADGQTPSKPLLTVRYFAVQLNLIDTLIKRRPMVKALILKNVIINPSLYQQFNHMQGGTRYKLPWNKLRIKIKDLNTLAQGKLPGLRSFNLNIQLQGRRGQYQIDDRGWGLTMPWLFRAPLQLSDTSLSGQIVLGKKAFSMTIDDGSLSLPEGNITVQMALRIPKTGSTDINLDARGDLQNLTRQSIYNYMPIAVLSPSVLQWLDTSILHVASAQSHFVMRGQLHNFPFLQNNGEFLVDSQLQGADLAFETNWPKATNVNARMVFSGESMLITANQGQFAGLTIKDATVGIPVMAVDQPVMLHVEAKAQDDAGKLIAALDAMPLTSITRLSKMLQAKGPVIAGINLAIPLANAPADAFKLNGYANLQQISVQSHQAPKMPLTNLTGTLNFSEDGLSTKALNGQWLGMPVTISLQQGAVAGETEVTAAMRVNALKLSSYLPAPWASAFKGQTVVKLQLLASLTDVPSMLLTTTGQGMAIALPAPLNKTAATKVPSQIQIKHVNGTGWQVSANYGPTVNFQATAAATAKQPLQLTGLAFGWGSQANVTPQQITVALSQNTIDLNPWITLLQKQMPANKAKNMSLPIQLQIKTQQLALLGYSFTGVNLQTSYDGKKLDMNIVSKEVTGKVNYQLPTAGSKEQLQIELKQLILPSSSLSSTQSNSWQRFPATRFSCQYLQVGKLTLGQVTVVLTPISGGLNINQCTLTTKAITINASGSWLWQSARTQLSGSLNTSNLSQALRDLGLSGNIQANTASAQFKLNWPGAPWQMSVKALQGNASLNIGAGKITGLSQSTDASVGLGKLISLLSIEGLMRIGDLTQEGFAFDKVTGQFQFNQGIVQIAQSEIKGVVADLFFQGQVGLAQQNYNLRMQVVGRLTSSLPVVATIAGGPVVGAVTWVVNKAVGSAVDKMGSSTYQITGTWQKPVISKAP